MTVATDIAIPSSDRGQPWRVLLWLAPLTAFWIALNYWVPALPASGVPSTAGRLAIQIAIVLGLWLALERTELAPRRRLGVWLAVVVPYTLWLAVIWSVAINGVFRPGNNTLPLVPLAIFLPVIVGVPILLRSKRIGEVLDAMPASWLIGLQVYRVLGGIFLVGWARGVIPGIVRLAGRHRRRDHRAARLAGRLLAGNAERQCATRSNRVEYLRFARFHDRGRDRAGHFPGPISVARTERPQHRARALSDRPDPGLCGAELDPAPRAVIAPAAPHPPTISDRSELVGSGSLGAHNKGVSFGSRARPQPRVISQPDRKFSRLPARTGIGRTCDRL